MEGKGWACWTDKSGVGEANWHSEDALANSLSRAFCLRWAVFSSALEGPLRALALAFIFAAAAMLDVLGLTGP